MKIASYARLAGCLVLLAASATAAPARAGLVVGTISGQVTAVGDSVRAVAVGDLVVGSYSYDDSIVIGDINPFVSFSLSIGTQPLTFGLADLAPTEPWFPHGRSSYYSTVADDSLTFFLSSERASELVDGPVDSQGLDAGIPQKYTVISRANTNYVVLSFTATPTTTAAVPEPAGVAMLAVGAVVVGVAARRRGR